MDRKILQFSGALALASAWLLVWLLSSPLAETASCPSFKGYNFYQGWLVRGGVFATLSNAALDANHTASTSWLTLLGFTCSALLEEVCAGFTTTGYMIDGINLVPTSGWYAVNTAELMSGGDCVGMYLKATTSLGGCPLAGGYSFVAGYTVNEVNSSVIGPVPPTSYLQSRELRALDLGRSCDGLTTCVAIDSRNFYSTAPYLEPSTSPSTDCQGVFFKVLSITTGYTVTSTNVALQTRNLAWSGSFVVPSGWVPTDNMVELAISGNIPKGARSVPTIRSVSLYLFQDGVPVDLIWDQTVVSPVLPNIIRCTLRTYNARLELTKPVLLVINYTSSSAALTWPGLNISSVAVTLAYGARNGEDPPPYLVPFPYPDYQSFTNNLTSVMLPVSTGYVPANSVLSIEVPQSNVPSYFRPADPNNIFANYFSIFVSYEGFLTTEQYLNSVWGRVCISQSAEEPCQIAGIDVTGITFQGNSYTTSVLAAIAAATARFTTLSNRRLLVQTMVSNVSIGFLYPIVDASQPLYVNLIPAEALENYNFSLRVYFIYSHTTPATTTEDDDPNLGLILGLSIPLGICALALLLIATFVLWRRSKRQQDNTKEQKPKENATSKLLPVVGTGRSFDGGNSTRATSAPAPSTYKQTGTTVPEENGAHPHNGTKSPPVLSRKFGLQVNKSTIADAQNKLVEGFRRLGDAISMDSNELGDTLPSTPWDEVYPQEKDRVSLVGRLSGSSPIGSAEVSKLIDRPGAFDRRIRESKRTLTAFPVMATVNMDIQPDDVEFPNDELLGVGAFGAVYRAIYRGKDVAVKVVNQQAITCGVEAEKVALEQEVKILARISHPNIVQFYGACIHPPHVFFVMELMATSLASVVEAGPVPLRKMLKIARDIAAGLSFLHPDVVHRDLKPGNILMTKDGVAKIGDFGLARCKYKAYLSNTTAEVGTVAYMAPECFNPEIGQLTNKCDIYSYGVLLWEMLTGDHPWEGDTNVTIIFRVAIQDVRLPLPPADPITCPESLLDVINACWQVDPQERPSCEEIMDRLELVMNEVDNPQPGTSGDSRADESMIEVKVEEEVPMRSAFEGLDFSAMGLE